jgi:hypothetical protein
MRRTLLTLDLATKTGWCIGPPGGAFLGGQAIRHGVLVLGKPGASLGVKLLTLWQWVGDCFETDAVTDVAFEAPLDPRWLKCTTRQTARLLAALPGVVEAVSVDCGLPEDRLREIEVADVSEALFGRRNVRKDDRKPLLIAGARALGHAPKDDNAADAIALHAFMSAVLDPALVPQLRGRQ